MKKTYGITEIAIHNKMSRSWVWMKYREGALPEPTSIIRTVGKREIPKWDKMVKIEKKNKSRT